MADMREINDRLDEIEAHLWWVRWRNGLEIPPPPLGARSGLAATTGLRDLIRRFDGEPDQFD